MAESPDEVYERIKAEELGKGTDPRVAEARAKAARVRAQKGLPIDPQAAAQAAGAASGGGAEHPPPEPPRQEAAAPEEEETPAEAPAAVPSTDGQEQPGGQRQPAMAGAPAAPAPPAPRGRGSAARAARAAQAGGAGASPDRLQRLLAVVKPEAIQRVEREPIDRVNAWPHLMASEFLSLLVITVVLMIASAFVPATFREMANINQTPNPSKAPWYFLGLQELLRYFHMQVAGATIPQWIIFAFIVAPFIDRNPSTNPEDRKIAIVLFTIYVIFFAIITVVGALFRGPGFNWVYPWDIEVERIFEL